MVFKFLFLFSKLGKVNSDFSFSSRNGRNCFQISLSLLELTFLTLFNHIVGIVINSLSSRLSTNVLFSKRLCKIGYLNNPDGYPKYPDGYINGERLCSQNVGWRGYVVSKVGIELLGQLKMK